MTPQRDFAHLAGRSASSPPPAVSTGRSARFALALLFALLPALAIAAIPARDQITTLQTATTAVAGSNYTLASGRRVYETKIVGTTTYAATVNIEGCLTDSSTTADWSVLGTISVDQTTPADSFTSVSPYPFVRARVTAVSGTITSITTKMSILP